MAIRHVKTVILELDTENIPYVDTKIGQYITNDSSLMIDDTIGPTFDIKMKDELPYGYEHFVILNLKIYDASLNELRKAIYLRSLAEYETWMHPLFQRYRVPFRQTELHIQEDAFKGEYFGNPKYALQRGDTVLFNILSPWKIDVKRCNVELSFVELLGHLGPEKIKIK